MTSIQNAYQGFAKQNYTMLDNLKLGYGGTQSEMQRLLKDAQKISGVKYDINNLNDVYSAIHVIQTELGITGTTAKEASTTLEGSITSMKAAYSNLLAGLADDNADLTELSLNLVYSAETAVKNIIPVIQKIISGISEALPQVIAEIGSQVPQLLEVGIDMARSLLEGITGCLFNNENGMGIIAVATSIIETLITGIVELLPDILQTGIDIILGLVSGLSETLPDLIPVMVDAMITIIDTLLDNIDMIIDTAIILIESLAEGLINALPRLIEKAPVIIEKLVTAIANNFPKIVQAGINLIIKLAEGLIQAIPQLLSKIPQIITSIQNGFEQFKNNMLDVGRNIVEGIGQGLLNAKDWLIGKIKELCGNATDAIKNFFGIHSPSRVMRDEVGKYLAEGIGVGFSDEMKDVTGQMQNAIPTQFDIDYSSTANVTPSTSKIDTLINMLNNYLPELISTNNKALVLDTGALVGGTIQLYDKAFGDIQFNAERGN